MNERRYNVTEKNKIKMPRLIMKDFNKINEENHRFNKEFFRKRKS